MVEDYPTIDIVNNVEKYKRVYCSDLFSSIELIPLETRDESLVTAPHFVRDRFFLLNDNYIFFRGEHLCVFDHSGKFLHHIGQKGQGPGDYISVSDIFFDADNPTIYVNNLAINLLEYDFSGKFIRSIPIPIIDSLDLNHFSHVGNNLFVGHLRNSGKSRFSFCLFNENGDTVKCFPNYFFFDRERSFIANFAEALKPVRIDKQIFLKNYVNDTIYQLEKLTLKPAYIFGVGKYTFPKEALEVFGSQAYEKALLVEQVTGTPNYFFYAVSIPDFFQRPKVKRLSHPLNPNITIDERRVLGIYNIKEKTNVLLDTSEHLEMVGIINDLNGGLSFYPRFYAGNNVVVDIWDVADMKEKLTDEYFAKQTIKDPQAHQKLKELLKTLKDDDNPVVVVAKLK